ncbi:MAG TPA: ATP-dependent sacrificial sulfur transferase LarE [Geobacteraceae bacterium]|nr:ATP-dependent sacrificial sulfur transferase LarE [Geobacteraceae bacterium]
MIASLEEKNEHLVGIIKGMTGCVIGFSGGVDSTLLFAVAKEVLGDRAIAVTITSEIHPDQELQEAREAAGRIGGRHRLLSVKALEIPGLAENSENRCYVCKKVIANELWSIAREEGVSFVIDGGNLDDRDDYRPGRQAALEAGIRSPLDEAGFTKDDIRQLSKKMGLATWDKPSYACLISRFPYSVYLTPEKLRRVALAEDFLREMGLRTVRVRFHEDVARIELGEAEYERVANELRRGVVEKVKEAGFAYVALDLQGYRTGAMNEVLDKTD